MEPADRTRDVIVTSPIMNPSEWGLFALCVMQVCAYCEVPPSIIEARANELNPPGSSSPWTIVWGTGDDPDDPIDQPKCAPIKCADDSTRIHYLLSC